MVRCFPSFCVKFAAIWLASIAAIYTMPARATASELDQHMLAALGEKIASCWTIPEVAPHASLRLWLLPNGELDGDPIPTFGDGAPVSSADRQLAGSAVRAVKKCAPYSELITKAPSLAGQEIVLAFDATQFTVSASMTSPKDNAGAVEPIEPATGALELLLEIERNAAAAMQARSTPHRYQLTATRTSFQDGVVYLEQDVGANYVVYATIYCAFNETAVDANRIPIGGTKTYSAVLSDVRVSQQQASSGFSSGVINFKQILLTSCDIAD